MGGLKARLAPNFREGPADNAKILFCPVLNSNIGRLLHSGTLEIGISLRETSKLQLCLGKPLETSVIGSSIYGHHLLALASAKSVGFSKQIAFKTGPGRPTPCTSARKLICVHPHWNRALTRATNQGDSTKKIHQKTIFLHRLLSRMIVKIARPRPNISIHPKCLSDSYGELP